jgi:hypothetical protein
LNPDGDGIFKKFRRWNTLGKNGGFLKTYWYRINITAIL